MPSSRPKTVQPKIAGDRQPNKPRWTLFAIASFLKRKASTVSTNVHLRKLHNFCLSMNWLPWPIIPKRLWPEVRFNERRAITTEEHQLIIGREKKPGVAQVLRTVLA